MATKARFSLRPHHQPGQWRVKVYVGRDPYTGAQRQRSKVFKARTKADARKFAEEWVSHIRPNPDSLTVAQLLELFMSEHVTPERGRSTAAGYRSKIDTWIVPALGNVPVASLDRKRLGEWRRELRRARSPRTGEPLSPRTVNQVFAIFKAAIHWAHSQGYEADPGEVRVLKAFPVDTDVRAPDPGAVIDLLGRAMRDDSTFGLMLWLVAVTGARRGELVALRWEHLDGDVLTIEASVDQWGSVGPTKTRQRRQVALDAGTLALLGEHRRVEQARWQDHTGLTARLPDSTLMFPSPLDWDRPRNPDAVTRRVRELGGGRDGVWLHGLRHAVGTVLVASGVDVRTVSNRLGHAKTSTTLDIYASPVSERDRAAAEVMANHLRGLLSPEVG
jgi:integrase